ncbi:hypothetical protein Tco_1242555 [Tanacetum coccineum]
MVPPNNLGPNLSGKAVNEIPYRGMIGSLMYLTVSIPDIQFSTCLCARYQENPKESHLIAVKRIFKKSTSAMSSAEAEYVAAARCCANILCMKSQLTPYDIIYEKPLDEPTFKRVIIELGMMNIDSKPEASVLPEENRSFSDFILN